MAGTRHQEPAILSLITQTARSGVVALDAHHVGYRLIGRGPETVVLLNGSVFNYRQWNPALLPLLRLHLGRGVRFLQLDYPGFGVSPPGPPLAGLPALADLVTLLLDELGLERVHLLGISLGSALGQALLVRHPARVATFAGFGNPFLGDAELAGQLTDFERHLAALQRLRHLWDTRIERRTVSEIVGEVYVPGIFQGKRVAELTLFERARLALIVQVVAPMLVGTPVRSMVELFASYVRDPQREVAFFVAGLPHVPQVPALLLAGTADTVTPPAMSRALHAALRGSTLELVAGVSHMGPMLLPLQARAIVRRYARWLAPLLARRD